MQSRLVGLKSLRFRSDRPSIWGELRQLSRQGFSSILRGSVKSLPAIPSLAKTAHVVLITALGLGTCKSVAEELKDFGAISEHPANSAWLEPYDSTLLSRRLLTQFEFEDYEAGNEKSKLLWKLRWAFPLARDLALGLQMEAPFTWVDTLGEHEMGWGDMEARVGVIIRGYEGFRAAIALNGKFPSASSSLLGDDRLELRPLVALRWDVTTRLDFGANLEYNFTPRDEGDDRVSATELKVPIALQLSDVCSCFTSYKPQWNDVNGTWRHRLESGVTWLFGPDKEYALTIGGELPLTQETFGWKGFIGVSCYFE